MCSHELWASNTSSRGASKIRVEAISRSDGVVTSSLLPLGAIVLLLSSYLELFQVLVQPVVALLPEAAVPLRPLRDLLQRPRLEPGRPRLPFPAPGDEPGPLQHLQVLGDGREADLERRRQLGHRGLSHGEPGHDGPARGVGQGGERAVQAVDSGRYCHSTLRLDNQSVKYISRRRSVKPMRLARTYGETHEDPSGSTRRVHGGRAPG